MPNDSGTHPRAPQETSYQENVTYAVRHARWLLADRTLRPAERQEVIAGLAEDLRQAAIEARVMAAIQELEAGGYIEVFTDAEGVERARLVDGEVTR